MSIYICICIYVCMCMCVCMYVCMYIYIYVCIYMYIYICVCMYVYMYMYVCIYVYICTCLVNSKTFLLLRGSVYPFIGSTVHHQPSCQLAYGDQYISPYWAYSQTPIILPIALRGSVYPHIGSTVRLSHQFAIVLRGSVYIPILGLQSDSNYPANCLKGISISLYLVNSTTNLSLRGSVYPFIWVYSQTPNYAPQGDQYIPVFGQQ